MSVYYSTDGTVKAITNAIQDKFESYAHRRENFGPHFKKKLGVVKAVSGHKDHIHLSVKANGQNTNNLFSTILFCLFYKR
jgi:hypothetical protein